MAVPGQPLQLHRCGDCGRLCYPAKERCPHCLSDQWQPGQPGDAPQGKVLACVPL